MPEPDREREHTERPFADRPPRFGTMVVTGTDQFQGRRYLCRCGWEGWTAWGHAIRHAESCPQVRPYTERQEPPK